MIGEHVMRYAAGRSGLGTIGLSDTEPRWTCSCGAWSFDARAMPSRRTGNNLIEAERAHANHSSALRLG